jgi:hypothetical protein
MEESTAGPSGSHVDLRDLGTARVRREAETLSWSGRAIDALHAQIARGEAALVIGIFGESLPAPYTPANVSHTGDDWAWDGLAVPKDVMKTFWLEERLPEGWTPKRVTSLKSTHAGNERVGERMNELRSLVHDAKEAVKGAVKDAVGAVDGFLHPEHASSAAVNGSLADSAAQVVLGA